MADNTQHIKNLFDQLDMSMDELKEFYRSYDEQKAAILGRMKSVVSKLAPLADTQASRAVMLRRLYWDYDISVQMCPFGRKASAQVLSWPTPFCRRDTIIGISTAQEIDADLFGGCQVNRVLAALRRRRENYMRHVRLPHGH